MFVTLTSTSGRRSNRAVHWLEPSDMRYSTYLLPPTRLLEMSRAYCEVDNDKQGAGSELL